VERVRVLIADDHPLFRDGTARAVASWPELEVVAQAANGHEALELIRSLEPDVALLDLRLPGADGLDVAATVAREGRGTRVLILSAYDDEELVYQALAAGAAGYVTKDAGRDELGRAVLQASRGGTVLAPQLAGAVASQIRQRARAEAPLLTDRELEVLALLCEGLTAPQIGQRLFLSTATVKTHLAHLYAKLDVSDRAAAVAVALRRGLVR
jgi:two-component system, NarL family, nitrate/nitrite response regulator NarL